jgi:hypothetical protein
MCTDTHYHSDAHGTVLLGRVLSRATVLLQCDCDIAEGDSETPSACRRTIVVLQAEAHTSDEWCPGG